VSATLIDVVSAPLIEPLIGPAEAARLAGLSIRTIYKMAEDGRMPPRAGPSSRRLRWHKSDIERWLSARPTDPLADLLRRAAALAPGGPVREWLLKMSQDGENRPPPAE
jgi:excisionase family DNA binding protein